MAHKIITWADGFGVWHARAPRSNGSDGMIIAVRKALRDELKPRHNDVAQFVWLRPVRVPELDTADTIVYRERFRDEAVF